MCLAVPKLSSRDTTAVNFGRKVNMRKIPPPVPLDSVNVETVWVCFTEECWRVSSRGLSASCWPAPPDLCRSFCEWSMARLCHPQNLKQIFVQSETSAQCIIHQRMEFKHTHENVDFWESYNKEARKFTSDSSWEGVGELLHVFSLCLCLVLFSSENNLNSTLRKKETAHAHCQIKRQKKRQTEGISVFVPWHP